MLGASTLELFKYRDQLTSGMVRWSDIGVGFVISFIVAVLVIKWFVGIVSRRGVGPFAWYRIVAGSLALVWLKIGRAHVGTPGTNANIVCRLLLEKKKKDDSKHTA